MTGRREAILLGLLLLGVLLLVLLLETWRT